MKLETSARLRSVVEDKLSLWWSPAQISLWLESEYRDDEEMRIWAIYRERICAVMGGRSLGQTPEVWSRWSQLEALHCAVTQSDQSISRWMSSSVIGLSPR
jgi:hypothetical protein